MTSNHQPYIPSKVLVRQGEGIDNRSHFVTDSAITESFAFLNSGYRGGLYVSSACRHLSARYGASRIWSLNGGDGRRRSALSTRYLVFAKSPRLTCPCFACLMAWLRVSLGPHWTYATYGRYGPHRIARCHDLVSSNQFQMLRRLC